MRAKRKRMHIDRANQITVSREATGSTCPTSAFGPLFMPTARTLTRCSSFGASEARDVSSFRFVTEVVDILAIFPQGHTLVVVSSLVRLSDAMWIADEESSYLLLHTEVNDLPGRFVAQIADAPLSSPADLVLGTLQSLPSAGILRAAGLLLGKPPKLLGALPFEGTDAAPRDDQGVPGVRRNSSEVDFAQVYCRSSRSRRCLRPWDFHTDVQFEAAIPDQGTGAGFLRQIKGQDEGFPPSAHRQDHPPLLFRDGLRGPVDRVEAFRPPRVLHVHRRMGQAKLASRVDRAEEGAEDGLDRLAMQGEAVPGDLLHLVLSGPQCMRLPCHLMQVTAGIPHCRRLHLSRLEATEERRGGVQSIDTYCLHILLFFFSARKVVIERKKREARILGQGSLSSRPL
jgi:hypothetical protein